MKKLVIQKKKKLFAQNLKSELVIIESHRKSLCRASGFASPRSINTIEPDSDSSTQLRHSSVSEAAKLISSRSNQSPRSMHCDSLPESIQSVKRD